MTVHHVALETRPDDADAVVAFFVLLGFAEVPPPATLSERARWVEHFEQNGFAVWLGALRRFMASSIV